MDASVMPERYTAFNIYGLKLGTTNSLGEALDWPEAWTVREGDVVIFHRVYKLKEKA